MRITLITFGSRGDVQPLIALGLGLQAAGHDVQLVTHDIFAEMITSRGLGFFPVQGNPIEVMQSAEGQQWLSAGSNPFLFFSRLKHMLDTVVRPLVRRFMIDCLKACQGSEAIIFSPFAFCASYSIAEKLGVPYCMVSGQPVTPTRAFVNAFFPDAPSWFFFAKKFYNWQSYELAVRFFWQLFRPLVNQARDEILSLPPLPSGWLSGQLHHRNFPLLYHYSPSVLPAPPDWDAENYVDGYWFLDRPADWQPSSDLCAFLEAGPRPVYVGFGSMKSPDSASMTEIIVRSLERTKQRGILLTGWGGISATGLPESIFQIEAVPHDWLFPQMAAVVHHGGLGTMGASLRAGVPSVIVPFFGDQPFWSRRFFELGVIPAPISQHQFTEERLVQAIELALNDTVLRNRVQALSERIRAEDGVARSVAVLSRYFGVTNSALR